MAVRVDPGPGAGCGGDAVTTSTVIDLIDNVIHDWTMSDDAMRWNPDAPDPTPVPRTQRLDWIDMTAYARSGEHVQVQGQITFVLNETTTAVGFWEGIEATKGIFDEVAAFWGVRAARLRRMHGLYPRRWRR